MHNLEIIDESRLVTKWSSNYDCIRAQINNKTKHAIYNWSELSQRLIKLFKVRFVRIIASFDSKTNDNQSHLIIIQHDKHAIRQNALIIIMLIGSSVPET